MGEVGVVRIEDVGGMGVGEVGVVRDGGGRGW